MVTVRLTCESVEEQRRAELAPVLEQLHIAADELRGQFVDTYFQKRYDAYLLVGAAGRRVLKRDDGEDLAYSRWLETSPGLPVPTRLATVVVHHDRWNLLTHAGDQDMQVLDEQRAEAAGAALAALHAAFWGDGPLPPDGVKRLDERRWRFEMVRARFPDLGPATELLDHRARSAPWTLCQGDLLPMNVLWDGHAATIIDFGAAGLRPYFSDPARFVVFGGPGATYDQPKGCRETFLRAYLEGLRSQLGSRAPGEDFQTDILLGELYERICCISSTLRRDPDTPSQNLEDLAPARQLARQLLHCQPST